MKCCFSVAAFAEINSVWKPWPQPRHFWLVFSCTCMTFMVWRWCCLQPDQGFLPNIQHKPVHGKNFFWKRWAKGFEEKEVWWRESSGTLDRRAIVRMGSLRGLVMVSFGGWWVTDSNVRPARSGEGSTELWDEQSFSSSSNTLHEACRQCSDSPAVLQEALPPPASDC